MTTEYRARTEKQYWNMPLMQSLSEWILLVIPRRNSFPSILYACRFHCQSCHPVLSQHMLRSDPGVPWSQLALTATVCFSSQLCAQQLQSSSLEVWNRVSWKCWHHGNQQMLQLRALGGGGIVLLGQYWPDQKIQNRVIRYELVFYLHNDKISISYVFFQ